MNGRMSSPVCAIDEYLRDGETTIVRALTFADLSGFAIKPAGKPRNGETSGLYLPLSALLLLRSCTVVLSIYTFRFQIPYRASPRREITLFVLIVLDRTATDDPAAIPRRTSSIPSASSIHLSRCRHRHTNFYRAFTARRFRISMAIL